MKMYYNIHDIVKIHCNVEYFPKFFQAEEFKNPDILIKQHNFKFDKDKHKKLGLKFYGGNNNLYLEYLVYGMPIQKLLLKNIFGKKSEIHFSSITRKLFGIESLFSLLLEIKLLQKGYTLIHAGGFSKDGKGYLIPSWSEMGKSSTIFALAHKFKMMSDDLIILSKKGKLYSYPMKCGIFFHSRNIPPNISLKNKIEMSVRFLMAKLPPLYLYIDPSIRIDLSNLSDLEPSAKLEKTYFLDWGNGVEEMDKETCINKIITTSVLTLLWTFGTREIFSAYCYLNDIPSDFIERKMRSVLEKGLNDNIFLVKSKKKDFYKFIERNLMGE